MANALFNKPLVFPAVVIASRKRRRSWGNGMKFALILSVFLE
jgi:hypothetical protein